MPDDSFSDRMRRVLDHVEQGKPSPEGTISDLLQECLIRLNAGDRTVCNDLWRLVNHRLTVLTRKIKGEAFRRPLGIETVDVAQDVRIRLISAIEDVMPKTPREFYGLANLQIRRVLLDTVRSIEGRAEKKDPDEEGGSKPAHPKRGLPQPLPPGGYDKGGDSYNPVILAQWGEFHEAIEKLPILERESFEFWYYDGLTHQEIAKMLGIDESTVKRRCRTARRELVKVLPVGEFARALEDKADK